MEQAYLIAKMTGIVADKASSGKIVGTALLDAIGVAGGTVVDSRVIDTFRFGVAVSATLTVGHAFLQTFIADDGKMADAHLCLATNSQTVDWDRVVDVLWSAFLPRDVKVQIGSRF